MNSCGLARCDIRDSVLPRRIDPKFICQRRTMRTLSIATARDLDHTETFIVYMINDLLTLAKFSLSSDLVGEIVYRMQ